jgi:uncharacterized RDD family membrane protein YckC
VISPSDPNEPDQPGRDPELPPLPSDPDQPPSPEVPFPPPAPHDAERPLPPHDTERPLPPPADSPFAPPPPPAGAPGSPIPAPTVPGPGGTTLVEWPQRAQSALIDWFGPGVVAWVVYLITQSWSGYLLLSLVVLAWALYNAWLAGETGQSYGRKWAATRLVKETDGDTLGGPLGVVRHLLHVVDAVICFIGFLLPLVDAKKQTIADKLVGSVVVKA